MSRLITLAVARFGGNGLLSGSYATYTVSERREVATSTLPNVAVAEGIAIEKTVRNIVDGRGCINEKVLFKHRISPHANATCINRWAIKLNLRF